MEAERIHAWTLLGEQLCKMIIRLNGAIWIRARCNLSYLLLSQLLGNTGVGELLLTFAVEIEEAWVLAVHRRVRRDGVGAVVWRRCKVHSASPRERARCNHPIARCPEPRRVAWCPRTAVLPRDRQGNGRGGSPGPPQAGHRWSRRPRVRQSARVSVAAHRRASL